MTTLEMLREALRALNQIHNTRYIGEYKDTYGLCSAIDKHINGLDTQPEDPFSSAMFKQLKIDYNEEKRTDTNNGIKEV